MSLNIDPGEEGRILSADKSSGPVAGSLSTHSLFLSSFFSFGILLLLELDEGLDARFFLRFVVLLRHWAVNVYTQGSRSASVNYSAATDSRNETSKGRGDPFFQFIIDQLEAWSADKRSKFIHTT